MVVREEEDCSLSDSCNRTRLIQGGGALGVMIVLVVVVWSMMSSRGKKKEE